MMKIKSIKIAGFRGFNTEQEIFVDDRLTIIYGPNSYGKTSISEALEWLLFGITSKVEVSASGKKEFKGTYRNIHFPIGSKPYVEIIVKDDNEEISIRGELNDDDSITRLYNGSPIHTWPWETPELKNYSPFILQPALQDLLLATPSDRYSRFSKLLGTQILDNFQDIFNSLATRYNPPNEVQTFLTRTKAFLDKITNESFDKFIKAIYGMDLSKAIEAMNGLVSEILLEGASSVIDEKGNIRQGILEKLIHSREEETSEIFDKKIIITEISAQEQDHLDGIHKKIIDFISNVLIDQYLEYAKLKAHAEFKRQSEFFEVGLEIINKTPDVCPFCGTELTKDVTGHIKRKHTKINQELEDFRELDNKRKQFLEELDRFKEWINDFFSLIYGRFANLAEINGEEDRMTLKQVFGKEYQSEFRKFLEIKDKFSKAANTFERNKTLLLHAITDIEDSFNNFNQSTGHLNQLSEIIPTFISSGNDLCQIIGRDFLTITEISEKFEKRLNVLAGTQVLADCISLLEKFGDIKKFVNIQTAIHSMKDLRACVTEFVSEKTKDIVEKQLTDDVMLWYKQIKTEADPDVHFSGFLLGGRKDRHEVSVLATSYGQELVSAVSSLSESKLNALGLSIKIANNVKEGIPFGFLIIDDPVQSLDKAHEIQISEIIRKLVEEYDKQIILLSHNQPWIEKLIKGSESLNGCYYQISGFNICGPIISHQQWKSWQRRLEDVKSICKNDSATQTQLQRAEEEIRLAVCDIACLIYTQTTGKRKSAHNLGERKIRSMLIEANVGENLVDRICLTFTSTDESHHIVEDYEADRERILRYHSWVHELSKFMNNS